MTKFHSVADTSGELSAALKMLVPQAFADGVFDGEVLYELLGRSAESSSMSDEHFGLTWPGKREARKIAALPASGGLRPIKNGGIGEAATKNVFIEGENLEVLKLLQKSYASKIKLIYIDPPYNTGNDFVYSDDYSEPLEAYLRRAGQLAEGGELLSSNTRSDGRFHSNWLSMMYPRLILARNLLREDGAIFVSIDDNEVAHLRQIMNEIFGEENFIGMMVWEGGLKNDARLISSSHDYLLAFARRADSLREDDKKWRTRKQGLDEIYAKVQELTEKYRDQWEKASDALKKWYGDLDDTHPAKQHSHYSRIDERGVYFADNVSWPGGGGPTYQILHPTTRKPVKVPSRGWVYPTKQRMEEKIAAGLIEFGPDETKVPTIKRYLRDTEGEVLRSVVYVDRRASTKRLRELMGADVFDYPKDEELLASLVEAVAGQDGDIVLDFFAGSASFGHACWIQNRADGKSRQFILVQLPESVREGSIAAKHGYQTIADIGRDRLKRVAKTLPAADRRQRDFGFRAYKLGRSNLAVWDGVDLRSLDQIEMAFQRAIEPLREDWDAESLYLEVLLGEGFPLDSQSNEIPLGKEQLRITTSDWVSHRLMTCFSNKLAERDLSSVDWRPTDVFVCRDSALTDVAKLRMADRCTLRTL